MSVLANMRQALDSGAPMGQVFEQQQLQIMNGTRADYSPSDGLNISMDFNAVNGGGARGTEVIIPDNASPELRAAAERFNTMVADFASANGIANYPVRGVRTRSENGRGVQNTVHVEPFFNDDMQMQELIRQNPAEFANIYRSAFGGIDGRLIAPHGVGADRGAASAVFGDETSFGELMLNSLLGEGQAPMAQGPLTQNALAQPQATAQPASQPMGQPAAQPQNALRQPLQWNSALNAQDFMIR